MYCKFSLPALLFSLTIVQFSSGKTVSTVIVDISHWQPKVDFTKVKNDGVLAVMHKATQGVAFVDKSYHRRTEAETAGLLWGAYHFGDGTDGATQARHFLETVKKNAKNLPVLALDLEHNPNKETGEMDLETAEEFVQTVFDETGVWPLVYGSAYLKSLVRGHVTKLNNCPLWIASWGSQSKITLPEGWSHWTIWQYTNGQVGPEPHTVDGIGHCDRDKFNGSVKEMKAFWKKYTNIKV